MITIKELHNFKSTVLGRFTLYDTCNKNNKGGIYLVDNNGWGELKNGYFEFNVLDENYLNSFSILKNILVENFLKTNYIIIKLANSSSSVYFTINRQPSIVDDKNGIVSFYITKDDIIKSEGVPVFNDKYTMSYILNDSSKEETLNKFWKHSSDQTKIGAQFSLDTKPSVTKRILLKENEIPQKNASYKNNLVLSVNEKESVSYKNNLVLSENKKESVSYKNNLVLSENEIYQERVSYPNNLVLSENIIEINNKKIASPLSENNEVVKLINSQNKNDNLKIITDDETGESIHINSIPAGMSVFKRTIKLNKNTNYPEKNYYEKDDTFNLGKCQNNYNTQVITFSTIALIGMVIYFYNRK